ncbi:hypothetical protein MASR2M47_16660 [Draconibacterium sp.]|jgi:hypothetical protein
MRILIKILFLALIIASLKSTAQQGELLMPLSLDSAQIQLEKQIEYRQLISGQMFPGLHGETISLTGFDFADEFAKRYGFSFDSYSFNRYSMSGFSAGGLDPIYSPFNQNGMVLSEGAYKFGDKFTFGGYSYGTSPMNLPPPMPGMKNFSGHGNTMFMQYKVNKNFKIETRFNISQGGRYPGF